MVCFGAVVFDERLDQTFYGQTRPISDRFAPEALAVSGFSREQHLAFDDPKMVMEKFANWLGEHSKDRPVFVSDNLAFDWQFINFYFHRFIGRNPFGFSGRRVGDLYPGLVRDASKATEWPRLSFWRMRRDSLLAIVRKDQFGRAFKPRDPHSRVARQLDPFGHPRPSRMVPHFGTRPQAMPGMKFCAKIIWPRRVESF